MTALIWILGLLGSSRGSSFTEDYYFIPSAKKVGKKWKWYVYALM